MLLFTAQVSSYKAKHFGFLYRRTALKLNLKFKTAAESFCNAQSKTTNSESQSSDFYGVESAEPKPASSSICAKQNSPSWVLLVLFNLQITAVNGDCWVKGSTKVCLKIFLLVSYL